MKTNNDSDNFWKIPDIFTTLKFKFSNIIKYKHFYKFGASYSKYVFTVLPIKFFRVILGASIGMIVGGFYVSPIFTFHVLFLLVNLSWETLFSLILASIIMTFVSLVGDYLASIKESKNLLKYLTKLETENFKIIQCNINEYSNDNQILQKIRHHNYSVGKDEGMSLGTIYLLIPPEGKIAGGAKAFVSTNNPNINNNFVFKKYYPNINPPKSHIFVLQPYANLDIIDKFLFFHEIGHITEEAQFIDVEPFVQKISIFLFPFLFYFFYGYKNFIPFLLFIPFSIFVVYRNALVTTKDKLECFCDTFAIYLLNKEENFESLKLVLLRLFQNDKNRINNLLHAIELKTSNQDVNILSESYNNISYVANLNYSFIIILPLLISTCYDNALYNEGNMKNPLIFTLILFLLYLIVFGYYGNSQAIRTIQIHEKIEKLKFNMSIF